MIVGFKIQPGDDVLNVFVKAQLGCEKERENEGMSFQTRTLLDYDYCD